MNDDGTGTVRMSELRVGDSVRIKIPEVDHVIEGEVTRLHFFVVDGREAVDIDAGDECYEGYADEVVERTAMQKV